MNVANLELCKELYELSGWSQTDVKWARIDSDWGLEYADLRDLQNDRDVDEASPAYDLGYLLRKLTSAYPYITGTDFMVKIQNIVWDGKPEDAAAKLAIELFKQGVLTKAGDDK